MELIKSLESKQVKTTKDTIKGSDHINISLELKSLGNTSLANQNEKRLVSLLDKANELANIHWLRKVDVEFDFIQLKLPVYESIEESLEVTTDKFLFCFSDQSVLSMLLTYIYNKG